MSVEHAVLSDTDALAADIARRIAQVVAAAPTDGRGPNIVLTGGTIAIAAYGLLQADAADWSRVHWWWGDERFVPAGHADRNDQQARDAFLDRLGIQDDHVHAMPDRSGGESIHDAADRYAASLPSEPFDLVLLGLGPDGHVASLFPGFAQLDEVDRRCVEVLDSPKPPPERITLTYPALNHAAEVWFLVSGNGKADAVASAMIDGPVNEIPARGVRGLKTTRWLLDAPAASHLP